MSAAFKQSKITKGELIALGGKAFLNNKGSGVARPIENLEILSALQTRVFIYKSKYKKVGVLPIRIV